MSAMKRLLEDTPPKPRIARVRAPETVTYAQPNGESFNVTYGSYWDWTCECRERPSHSRTDSSWKVALHGAIQHSRTHTAERLLVELERRELLADEHSSSWMDRGRMLEAYEATGNADGFAISARLIRTYLVKAGK